MRLWIGNRNYSSWSIRPWFFMKHANLPCEERVLYMDEASFSTDVASVSPSKRVPVLELDDGQVVWDSLAIGLTFAELFPEANVFPRDAKVRRLAYSACAEMHSGFADLRRVLTCNARKRYAKDAWKSVTDEASIAAVLADCARVSALFSMLLDASGGPFLGGAAFGYVDAYFVPVLSRFRTYRIELSERVEAYARAVEALPTHVEWMKLATAETHVIAKYEYALPLA